MMRPRRILPALLVLAFGCSGDDQAVDPIDECATCGGAKADGRVPEPGSCEADIAVDVANEATFDELDVAAGLNRRAAEGIQGLRPFRDLAQLDDVPFVGVAAIEQLIAFGRAEGYSCDEEPPVDVDPPNRDDGCEGDAAVLWSANEATLEELDVDAGLDARAAANLIAGRPFADVNAVDAVSYVGGAALAKLQAYGVVFGSCGTIAPPPSDEPMLAIISDLDKTIVPPSDDDLSIPPYPGVTTLYAILVEGLEGTDRLNYVTARTPERVEEMPEYLENYGLPGGPIDTGVSGIPWVAQAEKVRDASAILDAADPARRFVLFGDTSHRDPEVYQEMRTLYPDRIAAGLIHMVNRTVSDHRLVGLHLYHNYAEASAILAGLGIITADEAREVYESALAEGLELSEAEYAELLRRHGVR
ncbi:MAG: phosphatase domain-containing protein [Myxococcota bacterium]